MKQSWGIAIAGLANHQSEAELGEACRLTCGTAAAGLVFAVGWLIARFWTMVNKRKFLLSLR